MRSAAAAVAASTGILLWGTQQRMSEPYDANRDSGPMSRFFQAGSFRRPTNKNIMPPATASPLGSWFQSTVAHCDSSSYTPSSVAKEDFESVQKSHNMDELPVYTADELAQRNGDNDTPIWMSYGGIIYDVTQFINNHPGGSEKIIQAAGSAIEPFWYLYRQHFASDLPMRLMEHMAVGRLAETDQEAIDAQMAVLEADDPYVHEPLRSKSLKIHSDTPMNAELPSRFLTDHYLTPNDLFYIRHHHPVPYMTEKQVADFRLKVDVSAAKPNDKSESTVLKLSLDDLKQLPPTKVTVTLQCSGNRRSGYNAFQRTSGTPWGEC